MVSEVSDAGVHVLFEQHTTTELISDKIIDFVKNNIFTYRSDVDRYVFEPKEWRKMFETIDDDNRLDRLVQYRLEKLNRLNMIYNSFKDGYNIGYKQGYEISEYNGVDWCE